MTPLTQPALTACYFVAPAREGDVPFDAGLVQRLGLRRVREADGLCCWSGALQGSALDLDWFRAHDTQVLRLTLRAGEEEGWPALRQKLQRLEDGVWPGLPERPWAATHVFHAALAGPPEFSAARAALCAPESLALLPEQAAAADATPFGWLWELGESALPAGVWLRELVLVIPEERLARVREVFLAPTGQGLARIELYLQKAQHHARLAEKAREALGRARAELQADMLDILRAPETRSPQSEQRQLERASERLMRFLTQKAQIEILLNSLSANLTALREHCARVRLQADQYARHERALEREIEQLAIDLRNARTVAESTYSLQEIQRSAEANALQRASYLMGAMAALLAGVTIYVSFLELWSVALEGTGVSLPPVALRMSIGLLAGITWPLAAYFAVMRRRWPALLALLAGLAAVGLAVAATLAGAR